MINFSGLCPISPHLVEPAISVVKRSSGFVIGAIACRILAPRFSYSLIGLASGFVVTDTGLELMRAAELKDKVKCIRTGANGLATSSEQARFFVIIAVVVSGISYPTIGLVGGFILGMSFACRTPNVRPS